MARLPELPSIEIIRGFKGILDFYLWKGLACVRSWPTYRPANRSEPAKAAALVFGAIIRAYSTLAGPLYDFFAADAADHPRTPRDIFVSATLGHLHEASMSDFLTLLQESRDFLSDLTALLNALDSVGTDELDVNVEDSVLPDGASTAAHQVTQNADLATIATLADTLESIDTDALQIRGRDQLFSFKDALEDRQAHAISGASGFIDSTAVPANTIWVVTTIAVKDATSPVTRIDFIRRTGGNNRRFHVLKEAIDANSWRDWGGLVYLHPTDTIRIYFIDALLADQVEVTITGYQMTLET